MPRRHFLKDIFGMDYVALKKLYIKLGTAEKVSEHLGVTSRTIKNWLKEGGIQGIKHPTRERKDASMNAMRRWIKANPDVRLPRKPVEISKITGIPLAAVKSFFTRRRRRLLLWVQRFPAPATLNVTLKSVDGTYVPTQSIADFAFKIDPYTLAIQLYGHRKTGSLFSVPFTPKTYEALFRAAPSTPDPSEQERP